MTEIPFNKPYFVGTEGSYVELAVASGWISAGGAFGDRCREWLSERCDCADVFLTHSCTSALEAVAVLAGIGPGDEVIMPSFTFVSSANAFALHGATPVFVDIRDDTMNIDEDLISAAITSRTKAILPVHYAGVSCEMDSILDIAKKYDLLVIEDAAQGLLSSYKDRPLGGIGQFGTLSFHETKNVTCGEGGALLVNDPEYIERAEIVWEKGTNRNKFFRGQVDKYSWVDVGSSFGMGEVTAAFLWAQIERAEAITRRRVWIWDRYHAAFERLEREAFVRRPIIPDVCTNNAHMYYLLLPSLEERQRVISELKKRGIHAVFHYVPLHSSEAGRRLGRAHGDLSRTDALSGRLLRLPLWGLMQQEDVDRVTEALVEIVCGDGDAARAAVSAGRAPSA